MASAQPAQPKEVSSSTSIHSGAGGRGLKCARSVTRYGALGKNSSHAAPTTITTGRGRRRAVSHTPNSHGTQANARFQKRKAMMGP